MPGPAGIVMANNMGAQQTNDGTMIGLGPGSIAVADLFRLPNVRYSAQQLSWIGSMNADVGETISRMTSEVKSTADLFKYVVPNCADIRRAFLHPSERTIAR